MTNESNNVFSNGTTISTKDVTDAKNILKKILLVCVLELSVSQQNPKTIYLPNIICFILMYIDDPNIATDFNLSNILQCVNEYNMSVVFENITI